MKTLRFATLLLGLLFSSLNIFAQTDSADSTFVLSGKILDPASKKGIAFAHIVVDETRWGTICDSLGFFHLRIHPNQHLHITAIGFREHLFPVTISPNEGEAFVEIPMERQSYLLEEISVYTLGTYEQFKYNFVNTKLPPEEENKGWAAWEMKMAHKTALAQKRGGAGISIGFSGRGKKAKSRAKVAKMQANEYKQEILNRKFNRSMVENLTHETGKRLDALMVYINDRQMFTYQTSEYHISLKVKQYHKDFLQKFPPVQDNYALTDSLNRFSVKDTLYAK
ncbi:MAG: carboxypeptidase-like regulatory domain-containing protein [Marinifilaceae bacterium]